MALSASREEMAEMTEEPLSYENKLSPQSTPRSLVETCNSPKNEDDGQKASPREIAWKNSPDHHTAISDSELDNPQLFDEKLDDDDEDLPKSTNVGRDSRRFKSATLDRMGKMLKFHAKHSEQNSAPIDPSGNEEQTSRKQKFNSLSRMLSLSNKEDNKSKFFSNYRTGSLSRILRRKSGNTENATEKSDERIRGIFSRMLGQIRGRGNQSASVEPNLRESVGKPLNSLPAKLTTSPTAVANPTAVCTNPGLENQA